MWLADTQVLQITTFPVLELPIQQFQMISSLFTYKIQYCLQCKRWDAGIPTDRILRAVVPRPPVPGRGQNDIIFVTHHLPKLNACLALVNLSCYYTCKGRVFRFNASLYTSVTISSSSINWKDVSTETSVGLEIVVCSSGSITSKSTSASSKQCRP